MKNRIKRENEKRKEKKETQEEELKVERRLCWQDGRSELVQGCNDNNDKWNIYLG